MPYSEYYQKLVLDDIKRLIGISRPVRSSILHRLLIRKLPITALHPNPNDEFCDPQIGPNEGIIADYMKAYRVNQLHGDPPISEKLTVERMSTGGYMLLNGHHRWMAAAKMGLEQVPVSVVNTVTEEEIISAVNRSDKQMCVSFDLDEVLLTDCNSDQADHPLPFPYNLLLKKTLRKNAGAMINELQMQGFDVWVYSGSAISVEEVQRIMSLHHTKISGIVNFVKGKKPSPTLKQAFRSKYVLSVHVDNESILWVNTQTKEYDSVPVTGGQNWSADVFAKITAPDQLKSLKGAPVHA